MNQLFKSLFSGVGWVMDSIAHAIMPQSFWAVPVNVDNKGAVIPSDQLKGAGQFVSGQGGDDSTCKRITKSNVLLLLTLSIHFTRTLNESKVFISLACLVLAGCQSLYQHDDEPFDRFKAIEGVNTPVFQQKGHEQENFYDYDKRVEAYLKQRLKPAYDLSGGLYFQMSCLQEKIKESSPREIMPICKSDERPLGILMFHGLFKDSRDLYQVAAHIHAKRPCTWILCL